MFRPAGAPGSKPLTYPTAHAVGYRSIAALTAPPQHAPRFYAAATSRATELSCWGKATWFSVAPKGAQILNNAHSPGLTPGTTLCRHLRRLVVSLFLHVTTIRVERRSATRPIISARG